jgi:hypothetical protein
MGRFRERIGQFDDRSVIYRADDPKQEVRWGSLAVAVGAGIVVCTIGVAVLSLAVG